MAEKQFGDPPTDPRFRDPIIRDDGASDGAMWGWIAGIAVLILVVFVLIGGWNGSGTQSQPQKKGEVPAALISKAG